MTRRRFIAPEVVQTSAMDCGPAALKCLLEGFGVHVSYGRLREACQTDVDGTSIDTIEEVAIELGLEAEQVMMPIDHLLLPEAQAIPALLVVRVPSGAPHFVVLWRRFGPFVQLMDPASGRRWITRRGLLEDVYLHTSSIPASDWASFSGSPAFLRVLRERCTRVGIEDGGARLVGEALAEAGWMGTARLDAAVRMVDSIAASGGLGYGPRAARLLEHLVREAGAAAAEGDETSVIPEMFWCVRPAPEAPDGVEHLALRGAVLVAVRGVRRAAAGDGAPVPAPRSPELRAALREPDARPGRELLRLVRETGLLPTSMLAAGIGVTAVGVAAMALFFKSLLDVGARLALFEQRLGALGALLLFLGVLLLLEVPIALGTGWLGRHIEARLRVAFVQKIPRLGDRYLQSRPTSDMAERCHNSHRLRQIPELAGRFLRHTLEIVLCAVGIAWLDPESAPVAFAAAAASILVPLVVQTPLMERDLRVRNHAGALTRFYLDALLGLTAVRTHGGERLVRREHEGLLVEWARAAKGLLRAIVATDLLSTLIALGFAVWMFVGCLHRMQGTSGTLLLLFWALNIPAIGQEIALLARQLPPLRNVALRLLEPLGALEEPREPSGDGRAEPPLDEDAPVALRFEGVEVVAAGHRILRGVDLAISPGEHVAVVGASGAGKSTLVGLLLGWHRPSAGRVLVDEEPLGAARLEALRRRTAWVDPSVQLWNTSFLDNLAYGAGGLDGVGRVIEEVELSRVLEAMPNGLQTSLGEGGALVSGGEGQRVRLGRALLRARPRLALLDEPFRGLDRELRRALLARSRAAWAGTTMLCITHDLAETHAFDRVVVVDDGRVVEDGAPAELAARAGSRYRALLDAEEQVRKEIWTSAAWRRLRMAGGRVVEQERPS